MFRSAGAGPKAETTDYFDDSTNITTHAGGSRGWRNNNPGELGMGLFGHDHGAIGLSGGLAAFPDAACGRRALEAWLAAPEMAHHTVETGYQVFDPRWELPPAEPAAAGPTATPPSPCCPDTGLLGETPLGSLDAAERQAMAEVIQHRIHGWREGRVRTRGMVETTPDAPVTNNNILINGRTAVHAGSGGMLSTLDVCKTPTPNGCQRAMYMNAAASRDAARTATSVTINGHPACHEESIFATSSGDEGGTCGGVRSGTIAQKAEFLAGSPDVFIEGVPAVRQFDLMVSNNRNTSPMPLMQPGGKAPPREQAGAPAGTEASELPEAIVIEIAGGEGARARGVVYALGAEDRDAERAGVSVVHPGHQHERHRHVLLPGNARRSAYLRLGDVQHGDYRLPLGEMASLESERVREVVEHAAGEHANILVPIVPLCYTGPDCARATAAAPRTGGRLYLFLDGHLWREIKVRPDGLYSDVNLAHVAGRDAAERPASGATETQILVPYRIDGAEPVIEIAYARTPWSWDRINHLGGMREDDRRIAGADVPMPGAGQHTGAAERRAERMQRLDLGGYPQGFPRRDADAGGNAAVENTATAPGEARYLRLFRDAHLPAVYLHDPLGVSLNLVADVEALRAALLEEVAGIEGHEHYPGAVLAYRACFDEALWDHAPRPDRAPPLQGRAPTRYRRDDPASRELRAAAGALDRDYLEQGILRVERRRELRAALREALQSLTAFWRGRHRGEAIAGRTPDFIPVERALEDLAFLRESNYRLLHETALLHLGTQALDPRDLDAALDLSDADAARAQRPGLDLLAEIFFGTHPLHAVLFPGADQIDPRDPPRRPRHRPSPSQSRIHEPRTGPRFSPEHFAIAFGDDGPQFGETLLSAATAGAVAAERLLADFNLLVAVTWERTRASSYTASLELMARLAFASRGKGLDGVRLLGATDALTGHRIVGAEHVDPNAQAGADPNDMVARAQGRIVDWGPRLYDPDSGALVADRATLERAAEYGEVRDPRVHIDPQGFWTQRGTDGARHARVSVLVTPELSNVAAIGMARAHRDAYVPALTARVARGLSFAEQRLPALLVPFEMMMLWGTAESIAKAQSATEFVRRGTETVFRLAGVGIAIQTAANAYFGEITVAKAMLRHLPKRHNLNRIGAGFAIGTTRVRPLGRLPILTAAGAAYAVAMAGITFASAVSSWRSDDRDAAVYYGLTAGSLVGYGGAIAAAAIKRGASGVLLGLGPWGWAFAIASTVFGYLAMATIDGALEAWAKASPFAKATHAKRQLGAERSPEQAALALASILMRPSVYVCDFPTHRRAGVQTVVVEIRAPGFVPGESHLPRLVTLQWERDFMGRPVGRSEQITPSPEGWETLTHGEGEARSVIGMRYLFNAAKHLPKGFAGRVIWRARAAHVTAEGDRLPVAAAGVGEADVQNIQPTNDDGWVYAREHAQRIGPRP